MCKLRFFFPRQKSVLPLSKWRASQTQAVWILHSQVNSHSVAWGQCEVATWLIPQSQTPWKEPQLSAFTWKSNPSPHNLSHQSHPNFCLSQRKFPGLGVTPPLIIHDLFACVFPHYTSSVSLTRGEGSCCLGNHK